MPDLSAASSIDPESIRNAVKNAGRAVPPLWPLVSSVAVNPFLGQTGEPLASAGVRLARAAGAAITMPRAWYQEKIAAGLVTDEDLLDAWAEAPAQLRPSDLAALKTAAVSASPEPVAAPTIADLARDISGIDWPNLVAERFGAWAAGYFDEGQALWTAPRGEGAYRAWRATATHDLTPEILGLSGFARHVSLAPEDAMAAIARASDRLGLSAAALGSYFHGLLMTLGGWSQYARFKLWEAELAGGADETLTELLAIRLIWEEALFLRYGEAFGETWSALRACHEAPVEPTPDLVINAILQNAVERCGQRALAAMLAEGPAPWPE